MSGHILLIEDDTAFQSMLREALEERGHRVTTAGRAEDGIALLRGGGFDLVLSDVMLPGMSGVEAIPHLRSAAPGTDIIVMTAYSTRELALEAVKLGAYDVFSKPFSLKEMDIVIRRAMEKRGLQAEIAALRDSLRRDGPASRIIGESRAIMEVKALIEKVAPLDTTVLIMGESGTGKELASDTIRALSPRAAAPFVKVNCAAIPEHLFENELFGHEKGAFTGAANAQPGKFELAQGGTLMLDEIGDMPLAIQPKLLRVVEQKQVERLGGRKPISLDVRLIAATNQNLADRVREKAFREDLYYRLGVAVVHLPPLRSRKEDIPLLAQHVVRRLQGTLGLPVHGLTPAGVAALCAYDWPGNVRQLANVIERAAIAADGPIDAPDVDRALGRVPGAASEGTASGHGAGYAFSPSAAVDPSGTDNAACGTAPAPGGAHNADGDHAADTPASGSMSSTSTPPASTSAGAASSHAFAAAALTGPIDLRETMRMVERNLLLDALRRAEGRQTEAAVLLGLTAKNLWAKLQKHGIKPRNGLPLIQES
ncbi:sigma-54-dependent transcriptional regulator [Nitratidesulfovibrio termitidis]|uniref:sigma-54-dependent transcriptional regulator n=1 Tax=Nitratidesulfovibrio termitidis TaxID=42252 RepID=UPI000400E2F4|nr:sigma-54 dependent transcriptional regulator [Nitratidesulfovibrio termitidis]